MKQCCTCKKFKEEADFGKNRSTKDGLHKQCKPCHRATHTKYYWNNREEIRKRAYLINIRLYWPELSRENAFDKFEAMLAFQDNKCAICKKDFEDKKRPSIDHCHTTLRVRGLLCDNCNHGLGSFQDDTQIIENAKLYLQKDRS